MLKVGTNTSVRHCSDYEDNWLRRWNKLSNVDHVGMERSRNLHTSGRQMVLNRVLYYLQQNKIHPLSPSTHFISAQNQIISTYYVTNYVDRQTTFCLINISGHSTYSSVHCRWQNVSCCSRSSVEQSSITRHRCPPSLSIFCCRLKSHLFSLSYPAFWLFSHLYSDDDLGHFNHYYN